MEQDTAKTIQRPPNDTLLDFNRVGLPLIEIVTLPHIHHAETAAACVRKIQSVLKSVGSVSTGMEMGGLRADVNVSVRQYGIHYGARSYSGLTGLGQRTEVKNLSSFKAVEDAIVAERDRQTTILESGMQIEGETRGWSLGNSATTRLRGKEAEVDYRYMPDPDLPPLMISEVSSSISILVYGWAINCVKDLIRYARNHLPTLPDEQKRILVTDYGLAAKDAKALISLNDGLRVDYFFLVLHILSQRLGPAMSQASLGKVVSNWYGIQQATPLWSCYRSKAIKTLTINLGYFTSSVGWSGHLMSRSSTIWSLHNIWPP